MVTITLPTAAIKSALQEATRVLILELGETVTYKFHDNSPDEIFRAVRQKIRTEDLVGDYVQGDIRLTIDATTISKSPEKYDEVVAGNGRTYVVIDGESVDVGVDDTPLVFKPVLRG